jgi:hypothetical protein
MLGRIQESRGTVGKYLALIFLVTPGDFDRLIG